MFAKYNAEMGCFTVEKAMQCNGKDNALHQHMQCIALGNGRHCIKPHEGRKPAQQRKHLILEKPWNGRTRPKAVSDVPEDEWPAGAVRRRPSAWTTRSQISLFQPPHSCAERHEALWAVSLLYASLPALRCVLLPFASDWRHGHATEIFLWLIHPSGMLLLPFASFLTRSALVHFIRIREINA